MSEAVLPGTYIEVRPEGLIVPGRITVGTVGIVGTAQKGPIGKPVFVGSYLDGRERFGDYDDWDPDSDQNLSLTRALEIANSHGATTIVAVRVAAAGAEAADYVLSSAGGEAVRLTAASEGTWGNEITVQVFPADEPASIRDEEHAGGAAIALTHTPVVRSARNRIQLFTDADGITRPLEIFYAGDVGVPPALAAHQVTVDTSNGALTFGAAVGAADRVTASYLVDETSASTVSLRHGRTEERYTVVDGNALVAALGARSSLVTGAALANAGQRLAETSAPAAFGTGSNQDGTNGANAGADEYEEGLRELLNEDAHIILAAGQDDSFASVLNAHCQLASSDAIRRDRIAVVGSALGATLDTLRGHDVSSDRVVFVGPGIRTASDVVLPGAYAAAAVAGMLSSLPAHVSLTNKVLSVKDVETRFTPTELSQLVQNRVLALEARQGIRVVKGITTSTNTAWHQITTRRIVDFAKFGVRSSAASYIGLLNNERVRNALRTTITSFLNNMVDDEMLISYELDVDATRDEERQGIVRVTMVLRPTFSIDFIKVTMFLE